MMSAQRSFLFVSILLGSLIGTGCGEGGESRVADTVDWPTVRAQRTQAIADHIASNEQAYMWFMDFPFGVTGGTNFIILRLLPELDPQRWGEGDDFLSVVGLFMDERMPNYPVPRGIGWTGMTRKDKGGAVDNVAFSCGACHVGRVRLDNGTPHYLDGAINTQFNFSQFRERVHKSVSLLVGDASTEAQKIENASKAIMAALKRVTEDKNFFYNDVTVAGKTFNAKYEAQQVKLFGDSHKEIVADFLRRTDLVYDAYEALIKHSYRDFEEPSRRGFGGMVDATGISTSLSYVKAVKQGQDSQKARKIMPTTHGITDFMAVWEQGKRKVRWDDKKEALIDGGGQWNGNIPIPIFRNMAAELTLGLEGDTDLRISVFALELLEDLPAAPYPFDVDMNLAEEGKALYESNCADCHRPHNGEVYKIGTDSGRARVVSDEIFNNALKGFMSILWPSRGIEMPDGTTVHPGAEFEGKKLTKTGEFAMMEPAHHDGYNALPLGGIWAQAPYLHNGSVPTLYHLLVPDERPQTFIKSRLDYDKKFVGFAWKAGSDEPGEGYAFDTSAFKGFSNKGHDTDITKDGKIYKLDWSGDKDGALAIVEFMKTF